MLSISIYLYQQTVIISPVLKGYTFGAISRDGLGFLAHHAPTLPPFFRGACPVHLLSILVCV